ncbi:MAG TPA: OmpA family protein [Bacteroidia bacterium]|nr:OmpA family protein [Bacteroidia bacterium]
MKVLVCMCCFLFCGIHSYSQNLVLNPGFEDHGEISGNGAGTDNLKGNHVKNWSSPNTGSPDYFNRTSDYLYNQYGGPKSHSGTAIAGAVIYGGKKEYREYIMGEFSSPLEACVTYDFSIAIALASYSGMTVGEIGVYFSNGKVADNKSSAALKLIPQIRIDSTNQKNIQGEWIVFHETYTAIGGERYLTIGNFLADKKTQHGLTEGEGKNLPYAYYYFDDLSLVPAKTGTEEISVNNVIETPKDTLGITAGKKLVVSNVYFDTDKSILKEESFPILDEIISEMKNQPDLKVEIDGHTDSDGTPEHNLQLSKARANSVADYFVSKGIDSSRISTNGFGSSKPISEEKNKNRRVEFTFSE